MSTQFGQIDFSKQEPYYLQIAGIMEKKILDREILEGQKLPTEKELSEIYKVGVDTVKDALLKLVKKGYLVRRQSLGTFVIKNEPEKGKYPGINNSIGVVFSTVSFRGEKTDPFTNPYFHTILLGIEEKLREKGPNMVFCTLGDDLKLSIKEENVSGLIVTGNITPGVVRAIKKTGIPFLLVGDIINEKITDRGVDIIAEDDFAGIYNATKHLIGLGHKKILYFTVSCKYPWEKEHLRGYEQALKDAGILPDMNLRVETGKYTFETGYRTMKKYLDDNGIKNAPAGFTGMVCDSGNLCYGAMTAIREKGIRIPEDISVICKGQVPDLTVVSRDLGEIGRAAVERIFARINNPELKPERIVIIFDRLVERNSTMKLSA
jgi:DNA-binding LacI/PurR family transcriptional regulator